MTRVVNHVGQISGDDHRAQFCHLAAEGEVLSGQAVDDLDHLFGARSAPLVEVDLRVGDDKEGEFGLVLGCRAKRPAAGREPADG
jgi:hypothetical protein